MTEPEKIETAAAKLQKTVGAVIFGAIFGVVIAFGPVLLIKHRDLLSILHDQPRQRWVFYIVDSLASALAFGAVYIRHTNSPRTGLKPWQVLSSWLSQNRTAIVLTLSLFFYKACAALCFKLAILPLSVQFIHLRWWLNIAVVAGVAASVSLAASFLTGSLTNLLLGISGEFSSKKLLSASWAAFFYLVSIPLLFSTYFPLLAIPGAFIVLRWQLRQLSGATKGGDDHQFLNS